MMSEDDQVWCKRITTHFNESSKFLITYFLATFKNWKSPVSIWPAVLGPNLWQKETQNNFLSKSLKMKKWIVSVYEVSTLFSASGGSISSYWPEEMRALFKTSSHLYQFL